MITDSDIRKLHIFKKVHGYANVGDRKIARFDEVVKTLPERWQKAIRLRIQGHKFDAVSEALGCSKTRAGQIIQESIVRMKDPSRRQIWTGAMTGEEWLDVRKKRDERVRIANMTDSLNRRGKIKCKEFKIHWSQCPCNAHPPRVAVVKAENKKLALGLLKEAVDRTGIGWWTLLYPNGMICTDQNDLDTVLEYKAPDSRGKVVSL